MSARCDAHQRLRAQLLMLLPGATIASSRQRQWASATFIGARHHFLFELPAGTAVAAFRATAETHEFAVPGHIVADLVVEETATALAVEALTVTAD